MIEKKNFGFPIDYGDKPSSEGNRLSDKIITFVQTEKFRNISSAVFSVCTNVGGRAQV